VVASLHTGRASSPDGQDEITARMLIGSAFDDALEGRGFDAEVTLEGGPGNDTLTGVGNSATLPTRDWASYAGANGPVSVSLATGRSSGGAGNDTLVRIDGLIGSAFDDLLAGSDRSPGGFERESLFGGAGDDTLRGAGGDDLLRGGAGNDLIDGGEGNDEASYADATAAVQVSLAAGTASGATSGNDQIVAVERLTGTRFDDRLEGDDGSNWLLGGGGRDTLLGLGGNDLLAGGQLLEGGPGNDTLSSSAFDGGQLRRLDGGSGDDQLEGGGVLAGGEGNDSFTVYGGWGGPGITQVMPFDALTVSGGAGFDRLQMTGDSTTASSNRYTAATINLATGEVRIGDLPAQRVQIDGIEALYDSKGWDTTFIGDDGPNLLMGETTAGGGGNDTLYGASVDGGAGVDQWRLNVALDGRATVTRGADGTLTVELGLGGGGQRQTVVGRDVERLVFSDRVLAFGDQALEVARIAFALWSPGIAAHPSLFGKGIDWIDQGRSFDEAVRYALGFFPTLSDTQLIAQLRQNMPGAARLLSDADLVALMATAGGGLDGRALVTSLFANDAATLAAVQAAGYATQGLTGLLAWGAETLFKLPPGASAAP
jgi:Ca2+-binding RTX toxin-like protein